MMDKWMQESCHEPDCERMAAMHSCNNLGMHGCEGDSWVAEGKCMHARVWT